MEKVENLYCTARAQHVMPRRSNHVAGSRGADRFKPPRGRGYVASGDECRIQGVGPGSAAHRYALRSVRGTATGCWPRAFVSRTRCGTKRRGAAGTQDRGNIRREVMFAEHDRGRMRIATRHPDGW